MSDRPLHSGSEKQSFMNASSAALPFCSSVSVLSAESSIKHIFVSKMRAIKHGTHSWTRRSSTSLGKAPA